jgi:hypothetical protein
VRHLQIDDVIEGLLGEEVRSMVQNPIGVKDALAGQQRLAAGGGCVVPGRIGRRR